MSLQFFRYSQRAFPEYELKSWMYRIRSSTAFSRSNRWKSPDLRALSRRGEPEFWGLEDEKGRLMMVVNYNYDVSDFWQFSDNPFRPIEETNEPINSA